jgi:hypothetical protein
MTAKIVDGGCASEGFGVASGTKMSKEKAVSPKAAA